MGGCGMRRIRVEGKGIKGRGSGCYGGGGGGR